MRKPKKLKKGDAFVILSATSDRRISKELRRAFKNTKIELVNVHTAKDMIITLAERQVNLMIFDLEVNQLQGLEILPVAKKLRPQARAIVVSEDLSFETRKALVKEGVILQVQKPVKPDQISQVVTTVVKKLHPRD